ncbi:MAG: GGDEF domain-containing protein [Candidatus Pelethousia sp.]|nr:GGDEF domain-containing protein [Candidatus Pelethousia sp.]
MSIPITDHYTVADPPKDPLPSNLPVAIIETALDGDRLCFKILCPGPLAPLFGTEDLQAGLNAGDPRGGPLAVCREQLCAAYDDNEPVDTDFRLMLAKGSACWLNLKSSRRPDGRLLCVFTDVTRLKTAEQPPWLMSGQFRGVMRQAGLNIWEYDHISRRLRLMCVEDPASPNPGHFFHPRQGGDLIIEDFPAKVGLAFAGTAENEERLRLAWLELHSRLPMRPIHFRFEHTDKRPLWVEIGGETICDEAGRPLRDMGYFRDISLEKEREQEEKVSKLRLQKLEESALYNLRINLTNDSLALNASGIQWLGDTGNKAGRSVSQCMEHVCNTLVLPAFQPQMRRFLHPGRLLEAFEKDETSGHMEYQRICAGVTRWCRLEYHLARREDTGDICCYLFVMDIEARKQREQLLRQRAEIDEQSGVFNRQAGLERIRAALAKTLCEGGTGGFIMCDLDNFKRINDTWGHAAGDAVITETGRLLLSVFCEPSIVCRMGGDEFVVYCPGLSRQEVENKAQSLLVCAREIRIGGGNARLSLSAGVAMVPAQGADFDTLYPRADAMLYLVKERGKNGYCFAEG